MDDRFLLLGRQLEALGFLITRDRVFDHLQGNPDVLLVLPGTGLRQDFLLLLHHERRCPPRLGVLAGESIAAIVLVNLLGVDFNQGVPLLEGFDYLLELGPAEDAGVFHADLFNEVRLTENGLGFMEAFQ